MHCQGRGSLTALPSTPRSIHLAVRAILALSTPLQVALLDAPWPAELLEQPDGCEVWARRAAHLPAGLPATPMGPGTAASTRSQLDLGPGVLDRGGPGASGSFLRVTAGSKK